ncbi:MAG: hypothetical protein ACFE96_18455 [Candidatus Hermodarchaeota archaeon]
MSLQLEKVAAQVKDYTESLTFNGLNLISKENIKKIEFFLQSTSQLKAFRLATSLRYLHIELKRFLNNRDAFNIERYIFFLSNCWLLARAFTSEKGIKEEKPSMFDRLMGTQSEPEIKTKLILKVVGVEKIHLEGTIIGFVFYFLSIFGKTRGKILKWNLMLPYSSGLTAEAVLHLDLPNSDPTCSVESILSNYIEADKVPYAEKEEFIFLEKNPESKIYLDEESSEDTHVSISKLNNFYYNSQEIYQKIINDYEVTPFDLPISFIDYLYVKDVNIIDFYTEGQEGDITTTYVYELTHKEDYPLVIRIANKKGNLKLIEEFKALKGKKNPIEGIFCKLTLENGQLSLYPISIVSNNQITYPNLSKNAQRNKELMKALYKVKEINNKKG